MVHGWYTCGTELGTRGSGPSPDHLCDSKLPEGGQKAVVRPSRPVCPKGYPATASAVPQPHHEPSFWGGDISAGPSSSARTPDLSVDHTARRPRPQLHCNPYPQDNPQCCDSLTMTSPLRRRAGSRLMQSCWGPGPAMRLWAERREKVRLPGRAQVAQLRQATVEPGGRAWGCWDSGRQVQHLLDSRCVD